MRHIVGSLGTLLAVAWLAGCSAQKPTQNPNDVFGAMKTELAHSLAQADAFDTMDDELAHTIGTTRLTSEIVLGPMPLPETRLSVSEPKPLQTWGVSLEVPSLSATDELVSEIDHDALSPTRD